MVTINELLAQIANLQAQLQQLENGAPQEEALVSDDTEEQRLLKIIKWGIEEMRYEIGRIEQFLGDLSTRSASLITASGLISLLPFFQDSKHFFNYYVVYIFPFLAMGIFFYILAQRRSYVYKTLFSSPNFAYSNELQVLQSYSKATNDIWDSVHKDYQRSLILHNISSIFILCFLLGYILNFYSLFFNALPTPNWAVIQMGLFVLFGVLEYYRKRKLRSFSKTYKRDIIQQFSEGPVGGAPPDVFNK
jgi:hypothetical protein